MSRSREIALLLLGATLVFLSHFRWPVHVMAWVVPIPWLLVLRARVGVEEAERARWRAVGEGGRGRAVVWRALGFRAMVVGISVAAWSLAMMKIVTPPVPWVIAVGFGVPLGVLRLAPAFLWERLVARGREVLAVLAFGGASAVLDWAIAAFSPFGSWSAAANTQVDNLPFLQMVSVTGIAGPAFVMAVTAAALESGWSAAAARLWNPGEEAGRGARGSAHQGAAGSDNRNPDSGAPSAARAWAPFAVAAAVVLAIHAWGALRIASPIEGPVVRAAAVGTDATFAGLPLPSGEELRRIDDGLFARTAEAARAGAEIIVWNEAATLTTPEAEPALKERLRGAARSARAHVVAGYIVPVSLEPLRYENKSLWVTPDGEIVEEYFKHEPAPGEPSIPGTAPLRAVETGFGRAGGAICYDYDFPRIGLENARLDVGVVALPSSDWRGIDPHHTQMAAVRAIEGGYSIVRSTRFGLSSGIDATGRLRGWLSSNESPERVLMVSLPARRRATVFAALGDWAVAPFAAVLVVGVAGLFGGRGRRRGAREGALEGAREGA